MAKSEKDRGVSVSELKDKLRELVKAIVDSDSDDFNSQTADDAIATLSALKNLKFANSVHDFPVPPEFRCPISTQLMTDPVILSTGQVSFPFSDLFLFLFYETVLVISNHRQHLIFVFIINYFIPFRV